MDRTLDGDPNTPRSEPSQPPQLSPSSFVPSTLPSLHFRPGYHRIPTFQEEGVVYNGNDDLASQGKGERAQESMSRGLGLSYQGSPADPTLSGESTPNWPGSAGFLLSPAMARFEKRPENTPRNPFENGDDFENRGHTRYKSLGSLDASDFDVELSPSWAGKGSKAASEEPQGMLSYHYIQQTTHSATASR